MARSLGTPFLALLFIAIVLAPAQRPTIDTFASLSKQIDNDSIALAFDATDRVYDELFRIRPDLVRGYAPFLRENHLSIFADRLYTAGGKPITTLFVGTSSRECAGSFEELNPLGDGRTLKGRVFGWGWLQRESRGPESIVFADDKGTIIGLAHGLEKRPDVAASFHNPKMLATGWSGYYHAQPTSKTITAYAVPADGKTLCSLGHLEVPQ
jgi:hypothetical protein